MLPPFSLLADGRRVILQQPGTASMEHMMKSMMASS
jgi:hypothetical protein